MIYLFYASLLAAVITKVCDCHTTVKYLCPSTECNPIGKRMMRRYGMKVATWAIFVIACLELAFWTGVVLWADTTWVTAVLTGYVTLGAVLQGGAAHTNSTGRINIVTRPLIKAYRAWGRLWDRRDARRAGASRAF